MSMIKEQMMDAKITLVSEYKEFGMGKELIWHPACGRFSVTFIEANNYCDPERFDSVEEAFLRYLGVL